MYGITAAAEAKRHHYTTASALNLCANANYCRSQRAEDLGSQMKAQGR